MACFKLVIQLSSEEWNNTIKGYFVPLMESKDAMKFYESFNGYEYDDNFGVTMKYNENSNQIIYNIE